MSITHDSLGITGTTLSGKYSIEEAVGEGSFSLVYRALHLVWGLPVAIKCFRGFGEVSTDARERLLEDFVREGSLLSELSGRTATIVQARDAGTLTTKDGELVPYIVLEWLEGRTLESVLQEQRAVFGGRGWPLEKAKRIVEPIAIALGMVHRRGIAHRDVKPDNIWISGALDTDEMFIKLVDFGVAKVVRELKAGAFRKTAGAVTSFTPAYGAPEQFSRSIGATGPWTDVYAVALVLVEMLAGRAPLEGDDFIQLGMAAVDPARRPTPRTLGVPVSEALERVFARATAVRPYDRYPTATEFWDALSQAELASFPSVTTVAASASGAVSGPDSLPPVERPARAAEPSPRAEGPAAGAGAPRARREWRRPILATAVASLAVGAVMGALASPWLAPTFARWGRVASARAVAFGGPWMKVARATPPAPVAAAVLAVRATCPDEMATVPGGKFVMGDDADAEGIERPAHEVRLSPFCIDRREVTVNGYKLCADEGRCERAPFEVDGKGVADKERKALGHACNGDDPERGLHPVNCVSWSMAAQYCAFLGRRLPTEAEWELAARGTDGRPFPWGDDPPDGTRVNGCGRECGAWGQKNGLALTPSYKDDDGFALTAPVGSFPAGRSPYGLFDVAGNVWEWVNDWDAPYAADPQGDPTGPREGARRIVRGGGFNGALASSVRATRRYADEPEAKSPAYGFRCAKSLGH